MAINQYDNWTESDPPFCGEMVFTLEFDTEDGEVDDGFLEYSQESLVLVNGVGY